MLKGLKCFAANELNNSNSTTARVSNKNYLGSCYSFIHGLPAPGFNNPRLLQNYAAIISVCVSFFRFQLMNQCFAQTTPKLTGQDWYTWDSVLFFAYTIFSELLQNLSLMRFQGLPLQDFDFQLLLMSLHVVAHQLSHLFPRVLQSQCVKWRQQAWAAWVGKRAASAMSLKSCAKNLWNVHVDLNLCWLVNGSREQRQEVRFPNKNSCRMGRWSCFFCLKYKDHTNAYNSVRFDQVGKQEGNVGALRSWNITDWSYLNFL